MTQPLPAPVVSVGPTTTTTITFQWAAVTGATGYQVSTDGTNFTSVGTAISYLATGLHFNQSVTLTVRATGATPCQLSASSTGTTGIAKNVADDNVFVPNAFTPNGDGKNDMLMVYGNNIKSVHLWVYDQWGELQFNSADQSKGWDGTYKGRAQPTGVYVYYLEAVLNNGETTKKKGTITLLR
jgi:gliding motility-associated-like protein